MKRSLPLPYYDFVYVFVCAALIMWIFTALRRFLNTLQIRGAVLSGDFTFIRGLGSSLVNFGEASPSHLQSLVRLRESRPPIKLKAMYLPYSLRKCSCKFSDGTLHCYSTLWLASQSRVFILWNFLPDKFKTKVHISLSQEGKDWKNILFHSQDKYSLSDVLKECCSDFSNVLDLPAGLHSQLQFAFRARPVAHRSANYPIAFFVIPDVDSPLTLSASEHRVRDSQILHVKHQDPTQSIQVAPMPPPKSSMLTLEHDSHEFMQPVRRRRLWSRLQALLYDALDGGGTSYSHVSEAGATADSHVELDRLLFGVYAMDSGLAADLSLSKDADQSCVTTDHWCCVNSGYLIQIQDIFGIQSSNCSNKVPTKPLGGLGSEVDAMEQGRPQGPAAGAIASEQYEDECVVCLTEPKSVLLLPCRHFGLCVSCLSHVTKCPTCRAPFEEYAIKIKDQNVIMQAPKWSCTFPL